jgi:hypothetical protein
MAAIKHSQLMKGTIVRICAWFTLILFSLTSLVALIMLFTETSSVAAILAFLMCLMMSATGWYARKFGQTGFRIYAFSKPIAVVSMVFGIVLITLVPILFASSFGFSDSWLAIRNLLILFSPVVISAIAILTSKSKNSVEPKDSLIANQKTNSGPG